MSKPQMTPQQVTIALLQLAHAADVLANAPERSILDARFDDPQGRKMDGCEFLGLIEDGLAEVHARLLYHRGRARWSLRR